MLFRSANPGVPIVTLLDPRELWLRAYVAETDIGRVRVGQPASISVDDNDARLEIRIQDEGSGIPESELERVFEPFYRLEGSRSRETGGTGLGLTIAKNIVEAHGGRLTLANRSGGGLEARLSLPRSTA